MTHLSDFSYLQRCALEVYIGAFLLYRIWATDKMKCLHPKKVFAGELRSIITVLYIVMLLMQTSWDMTSTWIKYSEGFFQLPTTGQIINKPFVVWSTTHQEIAQAIDYVECVNLSMQTGVFFLLQCFWNYLSNLVAKKSFMGSWEFRFYIFWALGSVAVFPILQWYFREDVYLREAAPQLAYSIEVLDTATLGIRSHFRFKRILELSRNMKHGSAIVQKLAYFKDMNIYMTVVLFFYGTSLGILCVDGMTTAMTINSNKFASDLLIANCDTASVMIWIISIFHPRRVNALNSDTSMGSKSMTTNNNITITTTTDRFAGHDIETNAYHNNNNGASPTDNIKNGHRLSQRITNFIENRNKEGGFLRTMSPVEVSYPAKEVPKFSNTNLNVSVDDPYSNTAVNFTMVEPLKSKRLVQQHPSADGSYRSVTPQKHDYPMHTISSAVSQRNDFRFSPMEDDQSYDYLSSRSKQNESYHY